MHANHSGPQPVALGLRNIDVRKLRVVEAGKDLSALSRPENSNPTKKKKKKRNGTSRPPPLFFPTLNRNKIISYKRKAIKTTEI